MMEHPIGFSFLSRDDSFAPTAVVRSLQSASTSGRQADRCHLKLRKFGARGPKILDAERMPCAVRSFTSDHRVALGPWIRVHRIDAVREKVSDASDFFDWFE